MEKILFVCNTTDFLCGSYDFAAYMAKRADSVLVGVFLEDLDWEEIPVAKQFNGHPYIDYAVSTALPENEQKRERTEEAVKRFRDACVAREVRYKVHIDRNAPIKELLTESRYADLIVIDAGVSFTEKDGNVPSRFVKDILEQAECPVVVAPEYFEKTDSVIFAHDGTRDAVFAIKQFTYLFPEFRDLKTVLLEVLSKEENDISEKYKLREWLGMHYSDVELVALRDDDEDDALIRFLLPKRDAVLVIGGYGRGVVSKLFQPSVSEPLLRVLPLPVFITHFNA